MRNPKSLAVVAVTAAFLVPIAVFGAPALGSSQGSSSAQYEYGTTKVPVCHRTHSAKHPWVKITVSQQGWLNGHSKHNGDFLVTAATPCPPATTGALPTHGNHGNHGNNGNHGKP